MLSRVFARTVRHRRAVLVAAAVLSIGYVVADRRTGDLGSSLFPWVAGLVAVSLVLALLAFTHSRPARLTVRPDRPAFDTPVSPGPVYFGVRPRPDGVLDRHVLGSLFVPWEALTPDRPAWPADGKDQVLLNYGRPDLVRRRGVGPGRRRLAGANVDRSFLALVVQHYVRHPEHRPAIGTETEHRRLLAALG